MPYTGDKIAKKCRKCFGDGYTNEYNYDTKKNEKIKCPDCNGEGARIVTYYSDDWLNG